MDDLKGLTYSIINAFLGPNKSNKFMVQDKDVCITRCPLYILQNHHLQDSATVLMEETLLAHHELYGCSTLSLLAMWYFWSEEFRAVLEDGCEIQDIVKHSQNVLELAISALLEVKVSVSKILNSKKCCPKIITGQNFDRKGKDLNQVPFSIRFTSRHFSPSQNILTSEVQDDKYENSSEVDEKSLRDIVQSLNHDEDLKITDLVTECWKKQMASTSSAKFQRDGIFVCPALLPHCNSTVVDGLLIKSNLNHATYQNMKSGDKNRTLIIMGSLTYNYVHLGFSPKTALSVQTQDVPKITGEEQWRKMCCDLIKQLDINILVIKDEIDPKIADFCSAHGVLVFPHVPLKILKVLCKALQYSPCSYLRDCEEKDVIKTLTVKEWKPDKHSIVCNQYFLFKLHLKSTVPLQTIVMCHPSASVLNMLEHQIQHVIARLILCFQNDGLLPGGGEAEKRCVDFLHKHLKVQKPSDSATRITNALINGYQNYTDAVNKKKSISQDGSTLVKVMDEASSKINAWRSALSLMLLTLQCNMIVTNGVGDLQGVI